MQKLWRSACQNGVGPGSQVSLEGSSQDMWYSTALTMSQLKFYLNLLESERAIVAQNRHVRPYFVLPPELVSRLTLV